MQNVVQMWRRVDGRSASLHTLETASSAQCSANCVCVRDNIWQHSRHPVRGRSTALADPALWTARVQKIKSLPDWTCAYTCWPSGLQIAVLTTI